MLDRLPVRLQFPLMGAKRIPLDHAAALYGGLSRKCPELHEMPGVLISPIQGFQRLHNQLVLDRHSHFSLQVPTSQISQVLRLAGSSLRLHDAMLQIGIPRITPLAPSDSISARIVIVRGKDTEEQMKAHWIREMSCRFQAQYGTDYDIHILRRRVVRIHQARLYGYGIRLTGLSDLLSLQVQANPPAGKLKYGGAWFVPSSNHNEEMTG